MLPLLNSLTPVASLTAGRTDVLPSTEVLPSTVTMVEFLVGGAIVTTALLVLHKLLSLFVRRFLPNPSVSRHMLIGTRAPIRIIIVGIALLLWLEQSAIAPDREEAMVHLGRVVIIVGFGFMLIRVLRVVTDELLEYLPASDEQRVRHRRAQTQVKVLRRVGTMVIGIVTVGICLWTFPGVRALGTSILASAGLIGVLAGVAARSTFGNLIAGIQIAFAEPIRIDDVVVIDGQYGMIEEITLTQVIVRTWDQRRLVLPSSWIIENIFENWTKDSTDLVGVVNLVVSLGADTEVIRAEAMRTIEASPAWNGNTGAVVVTDSDAWSKTVRITASADDASSTFDLRCAIREHMVGWLSEHHPTTLVSAGPAIRADGGE